MGGSDLPPATCPRAAASYFKRCWLDGNNRHGQTQTIPAPAVCAVDTTGAGDAFNGALAAGLAGGLNLATAAAHACQCAAFSVGRRFCIPAFPSVRDVPW